MPRIAASQAALTQGLRSRMNSVSDAWQKDGQLRIFLSKATEWLNRNNTIDCRRANFHEKIAHFLMGRARPADLPEDLREFAETLSREGLSRGIRSDLDTLLSTHRWGYFGSPESFEKTQAKLNDLFEHSMKHLRHETDRSQIDHMSTEELSLLMKESLLLEGEMTGVLKRSFGTFKEKVDAGADSLRSAVLQGMKSGKIEPYHIKKFVSDTYRESPGRFSQSEDKDLTNLLKEWPKCLDKTPYKKMFPPHAINLGGMGEIQRDRSPSEIMWRKLFGKEGSISLENKAALLDTVRAGVLGDECMDLFLDLILGRPLHAAEDANKYQFAAQSPEEIELKEAIFTSLENIDNWGRDGAREFIRQWSKNWNDNFDKIQPEDKDRWMNIVSLLSKNFPDEDGGGASTGGRNSNHHDKFDLPDTPELVYTEKKISEKNMNDMLDNAKLLVDGGLQFAAVPGSDAIKSTRPQQADRMHSSGLNFSDAPEKMGAITHPEESIENKMNDLDEHLRLLVQGGLDFKSTPTIAIGASNKNDREVSQPIAIEIRSNRGT